MSDNNQGGTDEAQQFEKSKIGPKNLQKSLSHKVLPFCLPAKILSAL